MSDLSTQQASLDLWHAVLTHIPGVEVVWLEGSLVE